MADIREVLSGQLAISDQMPSQDDCYDDPWVIDLDDHKYEGTIFLPRHYLRYPLVGALVPPMSEIEIVSRFVSTVLMRGHRAVFVSLHPVPRAMCAARTCQMTIGGTIQGAILKVGGTDDGAFADDRVLDVMLAMGGGAQ